MEHRHSINSLTVVNNAQLYGLVICELSSVGTFYMKG